MDVSQLLRLYQARGWGALPAEDLLLYLKRQDQGRMDGQGDNVPRRNTDSRLGEIPRKEVRDSGAGTGAWWGPILCCLTPCFLCTLGSMVSPLLVDCSGAFLPWQGH